MKNKIGVRKPKSPILKQDKETNEKADGGREAEAQLLKGLHTWQIIKFSFKIAKIEFKGTPLPRGVIKMLANSILPAQIKAGLRNVLNEALGMYLRDTPGQRCFLQGELNSMVTPLEVLNANVGDALIHMFDQSDSVSGHRPKSSSTGSAE